MQALPIVLAFIGGGIAEALVAFAAHHLHRHPTQVELVPTDELTGWLEAEVQRRVTEHFAELNDARVEVPVDYQAAHRQGHWNRGEIKLMESILELTRKHPWALERVAEVKVPPAGMVGPETPEVTLTSGGKKEPKPGKKGVFTK